jgi:hypothetical protein
MNTNWNKQYPIGTIVRFFRSEITYTVIRLPKKEPYFLQTSSTVNSLTVNRHFYALRGSDNRLYHSKLNDSNFEVLSIGIPSCKYRSK